MQRAMRWQKSYFKATLDVIKLRHCVTILTCTNCAMIFACKRMILHKC